MKNNLDEMQEQELLKIEHNGFWLAFWLLLISMVVQSIVFDSMNLRTLAGEWIVFMILALYTTFACVRKGIWDRKLAMNMRTNLVLSAVAGMAVGIFNAVMIFKNYQKPIGTAVAAVITAAITFLACLVGLTVVMKVTNKRKTAMEAEPDNANEG